MLIGRNDVYQLGHVRHFDNVGIVDERVQEGCYYQRVFQVVFLFQGVVALGSRSAARAIPDVPLVPGDINVLVARRSHQRFADSSFEYLGTVLHFLGAGHKVIVIVGGVADVSVYGDVIDLISESVEAPVQFPSRPSRRRD